MQKRATASPSCAGNSCSRVPATIACSQVYDTRVLLLEWTHQGPRTTRF
ncbi:MAG: hypothetical protein JST42_30045 [Bacteroidetes bacterium]|nr:hypothetical protein [Bacteroidota bacterium]